MMINSVYARDCLLADGWHTDVRLEIAGGIIVAIAHGPAQPGDGLLSVVIPGMPNVHSHAFQRAMAGLAENPAQGVTTFWHWRETMYRFVSQITPDDLLAISAMAYVEMLESGFTRVGEFNYLHHNVDGRPFDDTATMSRAVMAAAQEVDMALTLLPVLYRRGGFDKTTVEGVQRRFVLGVDEFAHLVEDLRACAYGSPETLVGVAPHSLRAVSLEDISAILALGGPYHIHVAEQEKEVAECLAATGLRPVDLLLNNVPIDSRWCLVHATHMTEAEARAAAVTGAIAGLCPVTEANLGDGVFNARPWRKSQGRYGIGSDSNVLIDATEELRMLDYSLRLTERSRQGFGVDWADAVTGGSVALGAPTGLQVGVAADFLVLDDKHPTLIGRSPEDMVRALIFSAGRSAITSVWRRGERIVENGRHRDRSTVEGRYIGTLERLLS
jgi:formimidoylglutamate deiminase